MTDQTDAEFIAELKALAEKATKAPWIDCIKAVRRLDAGPLIADCHWSPGGRPYAEADANAAFIAAARGAIPHLIEMVEERERDLDESKKNTAKLFRERRAFWDALIPPGPRCRDCADCNGRCQDTGHPCDPQEHALEIIANLKTAAARAEKAERERKGIGMNENLDKALSEASLVIAETREDTHPHNCEVMIVDEVEARVRAMISASPKPLQELGEFLANALDETLWPRAESLLLAVSASMPAGWQTVPVNPSESLITIGAKAIQQPHGAIARNIAKNVYRAMLDAARDGKEGE